MKSTRDQLKRDCHMIYILKWSLLLLPIIYALTIINFIICQIFSDFIFYPLLFSHISYWWIEGRFHISPVVKICSYFISPVSQQPHLSSSLSLSFSLLYSPCVLSIYSTTYVYQLKSSLQVIQSVVQSYDTLMNSVVSKHHQKYFWKLSTVPTYYLSTYLPTTYLPTIYCWSGHK